MASMNPQRIGMRDFVEPLGVSAARMDLDRQTKSRDQYCLISFEIVGMDVTLNVIGNRILMPTPVSQGARIEFQFPTGRWESALDVVVDPDSNKSPAIFVAIRTRNGNDV